VIDPIPEWSYPHAPEMRPVPTGPVATEWSFLGDQPGPTSPIGTREVRQPTNPPAAPVAAKK
jgi:hypothetical protein